jgi:ABC-type uncharacterized transport system permease subunit
MNLAAPAYCTEIAPPQWRGKMAGVLNCGYSGGSISAAAITYGANYINDDCCWCTPLIGEALPVLVGCLWYPLLHAMSEKPRMWRISHSQ